jgi:hypothetical protein
MGCAESRWPQWPPTTTDDHSMQAIATVGGNHTQAVAPPLGQGTGSGVFSRILRKVSNCIGHVPRETCGGLPHHDPRERLVGLSLCPADAAKAGKRVTLDGIGRIVDVPGALSESAVRALVSKSVPPLTRTPAVQEHKRITAGEAVVDLHRLLLDHPVAADTSKIRAFLRDTYLGSGAHRPGLDLALRMLRDLLSAHPALLGEVETIASQVVDVLHATRENDNLYGRTFDTAFAAYLAHARAPVFDAVARALREELAATFNSELDTDVCPKVARLLRRDTAHWLATIPEALAFAATPTVENFKAALDASVHAQYGPQFLMDVAWKYMFCSPAYEDLVADATALYDDVIIPQRQLNPSPLAQPVSSGRHGVTLPYQNVPVQIGLNIGWGIRAVDKYVPNVARISEHDRRARDAERAIGIGMSGSANLMGALFDRIRARNPAFPTKAAQLLCAANLTFNGGHSINEAYTTFRYREKRSFLPTPYLEMSQDLDSDDPAQHCGQLVRDAIDHAFAAVIQASREAA